MRTVAQIHKRIYDGVNYRLRTFAAGQWAASCRPTSISFLVTERCNARCIHCDIWRNRGSEDTPSVEQWQTMLTDLRRWLGPVQVTFTGGEALLRPYTLDLVRHAVSVGLLVEVLTHGYWNDQTRIEQLAATDPWRITVSVDGIGPTHSLIRGREDFFEKTERSLQTLQRIRRERGLGFKIRIKTVVMRQNLDEVCNVARYAATKDGLDVFYQPIEQNYNSLEDPNWFRHSDTWPEDPKQAIAVVRQLVRLKREGLPIANSFAQLEAMEPYFRRPDDLRRLTQNHSAHERRALCSALTTLEIRANGDVLTCARMAPVGNIKERGIREIWQDRTQWWLGGCCLENRHGRVSANVSEGEQADE